MIKMENKIKTHIEDPEGLENLYRVNKQAFRKAFTKIAGDFSSDLVHFWKIRLAAESEVSSTGFLKMDIWVIVLLSLVTAFFAKLPAIFPSIDPEFYYPRNLAIVVFNGIMLFAFWQNRSFTARRLLFYGGVLLGLTLFLNLLPGKESDSIELAFIHAPLLLWCLFGLVFVSFDFNNMDKRIDFIRFNGELIIMTGLILIAGGMLTAITIGLFTAIEINIEEFYFEYVVVLGSVAAPIVAFYLIRVYPSLTSKIAPVIARVFTPLVLVTLAIYLVTLVFSSANIRDDRELLLLINVMLVAILALIVFSISELDKAKEKNVHVLVLLLLAALAIVVNAIALTGILSRLAGGFTPNRTVVLISNVLIFVNLILMAKDLFRAYFYGKPLNALERTIAKYLTIYAAWTIVVIFILPFVFGLN